MLSWQNEHGKIFDPELLICLETKLYVHLYECFANG